MKYEQYFELNEIDLKEIVLELLLKKGLKPKDDITIAINTNKNTIDGLIEISRSWGFVKNGIIVSCEVENSTEYNPNSFAIWKINNSDGYGFGHIQHIKDEKIIFTGNADECRAEFYEKYHKK